MTSIFAIIAVVASSLGSDLDTYEGPTSVPTVAITAGI